MNMDDVFAARSSSCFMPKCAPAHTCSGYNVAKTKPGKNGVLFFPAFCYMFQCELSELRAAAGESFGAVLDPWRWVGQQPIALAAEADRLQIGTEMGIHREPPTRPQMPAESAAVNAFARDHQVDN